MPATYVRLLTDQIRQKLFYELNVSGKYHALKEQLKHSIIKARFPLLGPTDCLLVFLCPDVLAVYEELRLTVPRSCEKSSCRLAPSATPNSAKHFSASSTSSLPSTCTKGGVQPAGTRCANDDSLTSSFSFDATEPLDIPPPPAAQLRLAAQEAELLGLLSQATKLYQVHTPLLDFHVSCLPTWFTALSLQD